VTWKDTEMPQDQHDRYEEFMAKAASIAASAQKLLNFDGGRPDDLHVRRASVAVDLAQTYGRLADIAARTETARWRERRTGTDRPTPPAR
jgi:hypothetical protein